MALKCNNRRITIILPVYAGLKQVRNCVRSVLATQAGQHFRLLIVDDRGPDPAVSTYVEEMGRHDSVELIVNPTNLGFVRSVNRALEMSAPDDVVILNSDTIVPDKWLKKLLDVADSDPAIGTITPMSNNAEICSFPLFCCNNKTPAAYSIGFMNEVLESCTPSEIVDIPTGVGFCMYVRRLALERAGLFDSVAFGRGYGEENDFCQRIKKLGFRNVLCSQLWVYHEGGVSFGDDKQRLIAHNSEILRRRHPQYFADVSRYIRRDPLKVHRLTAVVRILARNVIPTVFVLCHGMGGGTKKHVTELCRHHGEGANFLIIEPLGPDRISLTLPKWLWPSALIFDLPGDRDWFLSVVGAVKPRTVHVHHVKGLEALVEPILDAAGAEHLMTLHDYYLVASNPTLSNKDGRFDPARYKNMSCMLEDLKAGSGMEWAEWRKMTERLLYTARLVIAPSSPVAMIYQTQYPAMEIKIANHMDAEMFGSYPLVSVRQSSRARSTVAVIGALGKEKGADMLEAVASRAAEKGLGIDFHLIGYAYRPLGKEVVVHGPYRDAKLKKQLRELDPDFVWFPCLWPETYSYTLSVVLELGLPVLVPNLGALATRVAKRPFSRCVSGGINAEGWVSELSDFSTSLKDHAGQSRAWENQPERGTFYRESYMRLLQGTQSVEPKVQLPLSEAELFRRILQVQPSGGSVAGESIVQLLLFLRNLPGVRYIASLIPIRTQRQVKRLFVRRPLHELQSWSETD